MQFDIRNRYTGAVQLTAEIDCAEDAPASVKTGLAVIWAAIKDGGQPAQGRPEQGRPDGANLSGGRPERGRPERGQPERGRT